MGRRRTWTDDDLIAALDGVATMSDVVARLRLSRGGAAYVTVRTRMEQLGLELPAKRPRDGKEEAGPRRAWTEEQLGDAVAEARSLGDVFRLLGIVVGGSQWLVVRSLILERGWSTEHWIRPLRGVSSTTASGVPEAFRHAMSEADIASLVADCASRAEVIRALGFRPSSTTYRLLREAITEEGISAGAFESPHQAMRRSSTPRYRTSLEDILVRGSTYTNAATLKRRLLDDGLLDPHCAVCGIDDWCGRAITLHLDHVNGLRDDHRLENLRLLCPNCHSQTTTFAGRNKGRYGGVADGRDAGGVR